MDLPEENLGKATNLINDNTTPPEGNKGVLYNLNKAISESKDISIC